VVLRLLCFVSVFVGLFFFFFFFFLGFFFFGGGGRRGAGGELYTWEGESWVDDGGVVQPEICVAYACVRVHVGMCVCVSQNLSLFVSVASSMRACVCVYVPTCPWKWGRGGRACRPDVKKERKKNLMILDRVGLRAPSKCQERHLKGFDRHDDPSRPQSEIDRRSTQTHTHNPPPPTHTHIHTDTSHKHTHTHNPHPTHPHQHTHTFIYTHKPHGSPLTSHRRGFHTHTVICIYTHTLQLTDLTPPRLPVIARQAPIVIGSLPRALGRGRVVLQHVP
jgi:hypothetical protein